MLIKAVTMRQLFVPSLSAHGQGQAAVPGPSRRRLSGPSRWGCPSGEQGPSCSRRTSSGQSRKTAQDSREIGYGYVKIRCDAPLLSCRLCLHTGYTCVGSQGRAERKKSEVRWAMSWPLWTLMDLWGLVLLFSLLLYSFAFSKRKKSKKTPFFIPPYG